MRFYWLKDQTAQGQFDIFWDPGKHNLTDYPTKHHSGAYGALHFIQTGAVWYANDGDDTADEAEDNTGSDSSIGDANYQLIVPGQVQNNAQTNWGLDLSVLQNEATDCNITMINITEAFIQFHRVSCLELFPKP